LIEAARSIWGERWALCRMAVHAAAIAKDTVADDPSLADRGVPLCHRAARAESSPQPAMVP
jgi:hypothetical protein